jgi:hypothetical protein
MVIWLNGTFGAGKTTTARQLVGRLANARHFDPELVGDLLVAALDDHEFRDFQDLPPWRGRQRSSSGRAARRFHFVIRPASLDHFCRTNNER